jgi:hypothetical protein
MLTKTSFHYNEQLPGRKSLNRVISVTTQKNKGTVRHGDLYPGHVAVMKGSAFVNSSSGDQTEISERFFREISKTDVIQKELL